MLDESRILDNATFARYGHLLPDTLIRSSTDAADASPAATSDVAALAAAVLRAPESSRS